MLVPVCWTGSVVRNRAATFALALLVPLSACGHSSMEPAPPPTIVVENPSCDSVGCRTVQVRAFVFSFWIPQLPIGAKVITLLQQREACIVLPTQWTLTVSEVGPSGDIVRTDTLVWTPADSVYFTIIDPETFEWLGASETFVPSRSSGWRVSFSRAPAGNRLPFASHLAQAKPCGRS